MTDVSATDGLAQIAMAEHRSMKQLMTGKKVLEAEVEALSSMIKSKESELKAMSLRSVDSGNLAQLASIRTEKVTITDRRKKVDSDLKNLNQDIQRKGTDITKAQSKLQYRKEDSINDSIKRLQHQLAKNNFSLNEERKIVSEIDGLKRNKRELEQYTLLKKEQDGLREKRRHLREDREHCFQTISELIKKESELHRATAPTRTRGDLKQEIDDLYEKRRCAQVQLKAQERECLQQQEAVRRQRKREYARKMQSETAQARSSYQQGDGMRKHPGTLSCSKQYDDEGQLINTLLVYLQRFQQVANSGGDVETTSPTEQDLGDSIGSNAESDFPRVDGMFVLRKKDEACCFEGVGAKAKATKKARRERKKTAVLKPIVHSSEVFSQFSELSMSPPHTLLDVPAAIQQLQFKKEALDSGLPADNHEEKLPNIQVDAASMASTSYISDQDTACTGMMSCSESTPSTPEVHIFSGQGAPLFNSCGGPLPLEDDGQRVHRRLSHDSGACELETTETTDRETIYCERDGCHSDSNLPSDHSNEGEILKMDDCKEGPGVGDVNGGSFNDSFEVVNGLMGRLQLACDGEALGRFLLAPEDGPREARDGCEMAPIQNLVRAEFGMPLVEYRAVDMVPTVVDAETIS